MKKKINRIPDIPSMPTFGRKFSNKDRTPLFLLIVSSVCIFVLVVWLCSRDSEKDHPEGLCSVNKSREKGLIVPSDKPVTPKDTGSFTDECFLLGSIFFYYFFLLNVIIIDGRLCRHN